MTGKILFLIVLFVGSYGHNGYRLKQVLMLSRHNIRAPLSNNLKRTTDLEWPKWTTEVSYLTPKGKRMEGHIAKYIAEWLKQERLIDDTCPDVNDIHVYANTPQRTKATAKAFVDSAFRNCNITVKHKNSNKMDPLFFPIVHNTTEEFKEIGITVMKNKINELNLTEAYRVMDRILDFKNSDICRSEALCDLVEDKDEIIFEAGEEPNVYGPLAITNSVADFFLMSLYEGYPRDDIAWGKITELKEWRLFSDIIRENQNVRFNSTTLAKDIAYPLVKYMTNIFLNEKSAPKLTLLVGHDSNLNSVIAGLDFIPFVLPHQYERTPIGGKLVFQKWHDAKLDRDLLKVNYIYPTTKQLRNGTPLTVSNPPKAYIMRLSGCDIIENGFCLWNDFINILTNYVKD